MSGANSSVLRSALASILDPVVPHTRTGSGVGTSRARGSFRAMTHQVRRWLAAIILIGSGGTLTYCNLQAQAGGELEATLGLMLLVIGLALAVYVLAYPRR